MSGSNSIFTLDVGQGAGLGTTPAQSGVALNASRPGADGAVAEYFILLEDASGFVLLEDGTGAILLESAP